MSIPQNVAFLERGIRRRFDTNDKANRMRVLMANAVLGQMLPVPSPVPAMTLAFQIAQKVHGITKRGTKRAQDLVDLQLIARHGGVPYKKAGLVCRRLFAYRQQQPWPSNVAYGPDWETLYSEAASGMNVLQSLEEAIPWGNAFIAKLNRYSRIVRE